MKERIDKKHWRFDFDPTKKNFPFYVKLLHLIEKWTEWRIGEYRNYKRV